MPNETAQSNSQATDDPAETKETSHWSGAKYPTRQPVAGSKIDPILPLIRPYFTAF
jgi:hypothetical protein